MSHLQAAWFFLIGFLLIGYAVLDGYDLGVGCWHLLTRRPERRRAMIATIAPFWDGNEVWLVAAGAALFAAFPPVYATAFSGLYWAMFLVLMALIVRHAALEFRGKFAAPRWQRSWDAAFALSSIAATILFGVAVGNLLRGLPLDAQGQISATLLDLLNPYALLFGLLGLAAFATHGALWIALKSEGELQAQARRWAIGGGVAYLAIFLAVCAATVRTQPQLLANFRALPLLAALPVMALFDIVGLLLLSLARRPRAAFVSSTLALVVLSASWGAAIFPQFIPAAGEPSRSLTAANASSSPLTLKCMLIIFAIGMPIVIAYTIWINHAFRSKVDHEKDSY